MKFLNCVNQILCFIIRSVCFLSETVKLTYYSVGRDVTKIALCDFRAKIDFLALIDCLGVILSDNYGV